MKLETAGLHWRLDRSQVFLNHGSFGAVPLEVEQERRRWLDQLELDPVGFLVEQLPEALGQACLDLWHDHDRRLRLARRGRAVVADRTWEAVETAQGNVYEAVMRGSLARGSVPSKNR
jgi:glycosyltransferase involved in cell wall biosynthesis